MKVTSADTGGWKLFMRTADGWENVGTENGTIRLSTKLYDYSQDGSGFAGQDNFDDNFFDHEPSRETVPYPHLTQPTTTSVSIPVVP